MWYRIGTASLTTASPAITGAGTAWAANIQAGDAFLAPDNKTYEVQSVNSDTSITLATSYTGATASLQAYAIIPTQGRVRDLAAQVLQLITDFGDVDSALTVAAGRVGLGKSPNAAAKLDVAGQLWVDAPTGDATLRMLVSAAEKGKLGVTGAGRVYIESNGAEVMAWLNGNVTINAPSSGAALTVFGRNDISAATPVSRFVVGVSNIFAGLEWVSGASNVANIKSNPNSGELRIEAGFATYGGFATFYTNGLERVRVAVAGNVTINAPSSGTALTVSGGLRVDAATTAAAPTGGAAGALPALPVGYVTINIGGTDRKIPYYG